MHLMCSPEEVRVPVLVRTANAHLAIAAIAAALASLAEMVRTRVLRAVDADIAGGFRTD
jgi:hypothetical protein